MRNVPVEITEAITPLVIWKKELRQGSGGPGRQRGGLGQRMEITNRDAAAFGIQARFERGDFPARGRHGGAPGATGRLSLGSGTAMKVKGFQVIPAGDRLIVEMPGGGGYGDPFLRDPAQVARDVRYGLIGAEHAEAQYGVVLTWRANLTGMRPPGCAARAEGQRRASVHGCTASRAVAWLGPRQVTRQAAGVQVWADRRLIAANRGFHEAALAVAGRTLPGPAACGMRSWRMAFCLKGMTESVTAMRQANHPARVPPPPCISAVRQ